MMPQTDRTDHEARRAPRGTARPDGSVLTGCVNAAGIELLAVVLALLFLELLP